MEVPFARSYFTGDEGAAIADVVASGWVSQGPRVGAFERAFAARVGAPDAVAVSSCTSALHLALHVSGGSLYVGGGFSAYRSVATSAYRLAKLDRLTGALDTAFSPPGRSSGVIVVVSSPGFSRHVSCDESSHPSFHLCQARKCAPGAFQLIVSQPPAHLKRSQ